MTKAAGLKTKQEEILKLVLFSLFVLKTNCKEITYPFLP